MIKSFAMSDEARSSKNSCLRGSTTTTRRTVIISRKGFYRRCSDLYVIITITIICLTMVDALPHGRTHQRTIRLCSKSLSDALYLVCHDRGGYNEPFSYSGEGEVRSPTGPGLVEECCYRPCSYEQLEQYCKPISNDKANGNDNSQDGIEESLRIVNLPYTEIVSERRAVSSHHNDGANDKSSA